METLGLDGVMPTEAQLRKQNLSSLSDALHEMGGYAAVAARLGLKTSKPKGYWLQFENVVAELKAFLGDTVKALPTQAELRKAGRTDLISAMQAHGGMQRFAEYLEIKMSEQKVRTTAYSQRRQLDDELRAFSRRYGIEGVMPSSQLLMAWGREDIMHGVLRHGGADHVAKRTGLTIRRPDSELEQISHELKQMARSFGDERVLPTIEQLNAHGREDLSSRLEKRGYIESACLLGMRALRSDVPEPGVERRLVVSKSSAATTKTAPTIRRTRQQPAAHGVPKVRDEALKATTSRRGECMLGPNEIVDMKEKIKAKLLSRTPTTSTSSVWKSLL